MRKIDFKVIPAVLLLASGVSTFGQTATIHGIQREVQVLNDTTYMKLDDLENVGKYNPNYNCVPYEGRLVFVTEVNGNLVVPVRALGSNYTYSWQNDNLVVNKVKDEISTYQFAQLSYDEIKNISDYDITATVRTLFWDNQQKKLMNVEYDYRLAPNEVKPLNKRDNTISSEITVITGVYGEPISTFYGDGYIDTQVIRNMFAEKFPMYYPEYKLSDGTIVKVKSKQNGLCSIIYDDGKEDTVNASKLSMMRENRLNKTPVSDRDIVQFITKKGYKSDTDYLIFTDISRQTTYVLKKDGDSWKVEKSLLSSTGLNVTPTPTGEYSLVKKVPSFGQEKGYCCKYAVGFIGGSYLYHSTIFDKSGSYLLEGKGVLGHQASQGCIRFSPEEAKWFYENMPLGSKVIIR